MSERSSTQVPRAGFRVLAPVSGSNIFLRSGTNLGKFDCQMGFALETGQEMGLFLLISSGSQDCWHRWPEQTRQDVNAQSGWLWSVCEPRLVWLVPAGRWLKGGFGGLFLGGRWSQGVFGAIAWVVAVCFVSLVSRLGCCVCVCV